MKLTAKDIEYVQGCIDEAISYYGNIPIYFLALDLQSTNLNSPYKESKGKKYKHAIELEGLAELKPKPEKISPIGVENNVSALFEFSLTDLEGKLVLNEDVLRGKIRYNNTDYDIINLVPLTNLATEAVSYVFECREVK